MSMTFSEIQVTCFFNTFVADFQHEIHTANQRWHVWTLPKWLFNFTPFIRLELKLLKVYFKHQVLPPNAKCSSRITLNDISLLYNNTRSIKFMFWKATSLKCLLKAGEKMNSTKGQCYFFFLPTNEHQSREYAVRC